MLIDHLFDILVPGRAPSNVSISDVRSTQLTVSWSPVALEYHNGRLLGYKVHFYQFANYYLLPNASVVTINSPNTTRVTLTGLYPGQRYIIYVTAFTSKGEGPRSSYYSIKTGTC